MTFLYIVVLILTCFKTDTNATYLVNEFKLYPNID